MIDNYYNTKETVEEYIQLAKDVSGIELIDKFKNYLQKKSSLLELGSGPGTDWEILKKTFNTVGSDNSTKF